MNVQPDDVDEIPELPEQDTPTEKVDEIRELPESDLPTDGEAETAEQPAPLNRAARRGQRQTTVTPGHVGPQHVQTRSARGGARTYTKRRSG